MTVVIWMLHIVLVLHLQLGLFEKSPLGQDLHGLDVLDGSQLFSVVLVAAEGVEVDFLSEPLVLVLHNFQDVGNLLAVEYLFVVHPCD